MRIAAVFHKGERLRHIGHLDIQRAFMRAFRRSGLPVSYSNGYNPHILVAFASPLSVGAIGEREMMEVKLDQDIPVETFLQKMNEALPQELQLLAARELDERHPALMASVCAAGYEIRPLADDREQITACIDAFLKQDEILAERKTKSGVREVNIRPLILSLDGSEGVLNAVLVLTEKEACKPDMLLSALSRFAGCEIPRVQLIRRQLYGRDEAGALKPLEEL